MTTNVDDAIQILLDQMDAHPEDFGKIYGQETMRENYNRFWRLRDMLLSEAQRRRGPRGDKSDLIGGLTTHHFWFLEEEEIDRLLEGLKQSARQYFVQDIVKTLAAPEQQDARMTDAFGYVQQKREGAAIPGTVGTLLSNSAGVYNSLITSDTTGLKTYTNQYNPR